MIPSGVEIFVGLQPIDLRWSFDRLAGIVEGTFGRDVRGGAMFVFFGRRRSALKILFHDGTGLCLFYKRLDAGLFTVPKGLSDDRIVEVAPHVIDALLDGVDVERSRTDASAPSRKSATPKRRLH